VEIIINRPLLPSRLRLIGIHRASARTAETMEAWFASTWEGQEYAARKRRAQVRQGAFCCS
jgi:hypothetical protein